MNNENLKPVGNVRVSIKGREGQLIEDFNIKNAVLATGRNALANSLANNLGNNSAYNYFISRLLLGDGGTADGVPKYVNTNREGFFGITRASMSVMATIDPNNPSQIVFTSVLGFDDANGYALNEMALQMNNGDFYSMTTFPDFNKTSAVQVTFDWSITFV